LKKNHPLVLIEWLDSAQPIASWQYLHDIESGAPIFCSSVGWLIQNDKNVKTLAPNVGEWGSDEHAQVCGIIRIPTRSIKRIVKLREVKK